MPNINELFDSFPDYDVFSDSTKKPKKIKEKTYNNSYTNSGRSNTDYGDGYGVYIGTPKKKQNFMTIFFSPTVILWLEITLRLSCNESLMTSSLLYIFMFTVPIASIFTLLCTFCSRRVNRFICNIFVLLLTIWYCTQIIYYDVFGTFLVVSSISDAGQAANSFDMIIDAFISRKFYIIAEFIPLLFNLIIGKHIFTFKKIRIPAKISLILVAVLFQLFSITTLSFSKNSASNTSSYALYHEELQQNNLQERFGLLTMQRLDVTKLFLGTKSEIKTTETEPTTELVAKTAKTAQITNANTEKS